MAERYEFVIDFSKYKIGTQIVLKNLNPKVNVEYPNPNVIMRFDIVRQETDDSEIPSKLRSVELIPETVMRTREWQFERGGGLWVVNGKIWDENRVNANPGLGDVEIWRLHNKAGGWFHPVHIHLVDVQILSRNGKPPFDYERDWKDVFYVGPNEDVRVIAKFGPHAR